jgi:hypothetical protein
MSSHHPQPADPSEQPTTPTSAGKSVWVVASLAVAAVAGVVVLAMIYDTAAAGRDDAERALSETEANLADIETDLAETQANLAHSEANLAETEANLADNQADLSDTRTKLADNEADLAETQANLAASESLVIEYRDATANFLAFSMGSAIDITDDEATCLAHALVDSLGPDALGGMTNAESTDQFGLEAMRMASGCGVTLDTFAPEPGFAYGDNPTMDTLYDECAEGVGASCDVLYQQSGVRTEYESFGLTCGNRFEPESAPLLCAGSI